MEAPVWTQNETQKWGKPHIPMVIIIAPSESWLVVKGSFGSCPSDESVAAKRLTSGAKESLLFLQWKPWAMEVEIQGCVNANAFSQELKKCKAAMGYYILVFVQTHTHTHTTTLFRITSANSAVHRTISDILCAANNIHVNKRERLL